MKNARMTLFFVLAAPLFLVNCNGNKGGSTAAAPITPSDVAGGCLQTARGCLPQGTCPTNFGMQGNECYPVIGVNGVCAPNEAMTQFGCLSQGSCEPGKVAYENTCIRPPRSGRATFFN